MSDREARRKWARRILAEAEAELATWRPNDEPYRIALRRMAADPRVERVVAEIGVRIKLTLAFARKARRDAAEEACWQMMHTIAFVVADPHCRMVPAREILQKHEEVERARSLAMSVTPWDKHEAEKRDAYVAGLDEMSAQLERAVFGLNRCGD